MFAFLRIVSSKNERERNAKLFGYNHGLIQCQRLRAHRKIPRQIEEERFKVQCREFHIELCIY